MPSWRQVEAFDVPFEVGGERRQLLRREVDVAEPLELAVLVGGHVDAAAIGREHAGSVRHVLRGIGERRLLAVRRVDQPEVLLVIDTNSTTSSRLSSGDQSSACQPPPVTCSTSLSVFGLGRIHDVEVAVGAVAARRAVGEAIALGAPDGAAVLRAAAVGEQRDAAVGHVVAIELRELVAADVLAEHEVAALHRLERGAADRLVEEGQLRARAAGKLDVVNLRGVAEARRDQHLAPRRVPVGEVRGTRLGVAPHLVGERRRDRGNAVDDEVLGWCQRSDLSGETEHGRACEDQRANGADTHRPSVSITDVPGARRDSEFVE